MQNNHNFNTHKEAVIALSGIEIKSNRAEDKIENEVQLNYQRLRGSQQSGEGRQRADIPLVNNEGLCSRYSTRRIVVGVGIMLTIVSIAVVVVVVFVRKSERKKDETKFKFQDIQEVKQTSIDNDQELLLHASFALLFLAAGLIAAKCAQYIDQRFFATKTTNSVVPNSTSNKSSSVRENSIELTI